MQIWNEEKCIVGEGILFDGRTDTVWFLDIRGKRLYKSHYPSGAYETIELPQQVGCMALCEDGRVLAAMEDGVYWTDTLEKAHQDIPIKGRRFNDGKVGPDGAFYLGTTDNDGKGAFYRLKDGVLTELFDGCACSNGLDWTADGKQMYYIDTPTQMVELFDFENGSLSNRRCFVKIPEDMGKPDGMTLDSRGDLWVALWGGSGVLHIDSTGKILEKLEVPGKQASCCAFGGKNLETLFITSAAFEEPSPGAGKTYYCKPGVSGNPIFYYK